MSPWPALAELAGKCWAANVIGWQMSQVGKCHRLANVSVGKYPVSKYLGGKSHGDQMTGGIGPGGKVLAGKWVFTEAHAKSI